jgi:uncharacterized protein YndB with AHSA1/START domain
VTAFSNTVEIARSPAIVFAYLADLENIPEWNWAIVSARKVSSGRAGVGTRYEQRRSVPRPAVEMLEVTELDSDRRIEIVGDLGPFKARLTYELSSIGAGTSLTNTVELEPRGPLGAVAGLFPGRIREVVAENLEVLKSLLQQGRFASVVTG